MKYDYLVVGSGLYGAVFAREAADRGKKVLVLILFSIEKNILRILTSHRTEGIKRRLTA